ncbi:hypothetical protein PFISCL1PPCAC_4873, partial [Pristionchus fissidentatus]
VLMDFGYQTQTVCEPFFYDDSLVALESLDAQNGYAYNLTAVNGSMTRVTFSRIMQQCSKDASFISAVEIYDLLRVVDIFETTVLGNTFVNAIVDADIDSLSKEELQKLTN